jgi:DNA-binding transcriptional regulator LsrR (DeoR family)
MQNKVIQQAQRTIEKEAAKRRAQALKLYNEGKKMHEIAKIMGGISRQRVSVMINKARHEAKG